MADETIDVRDATGGTQSISVDNVGGSKYQRVKLDGGGDGLSVSITAGQTTASASLPVVLATDGTLIPGTSASALGKAEDAAHTSGDVGVMALGVRKDTAASTAGTDGDYAALITDSTGRQWVNTELPDAAALADGTANPTVPLAGAAGMRYNGATWDREYNNTEGTLLASAARTASTFTPTQTNYNARGVIVTVHVSAAGTGTLRFDLYPVVPATGAASQAIATSSTIAGTSAYFHILYPGAAGTVSTFVRLFASIPCPRTWLGYVVSSDGSSWTYSVSYQYTI